jgi:hypothetical protein
VDGGVTIDCDRRRHDRGACAPVSALNAGIAEIDAAIAGTFNAGIAGIDAAISGTFNAGIAEFDAEIAGMGATITGIADINEIKIRRRTRARRDRGKNHPNSKPHKRKPATAVLTKKGGGPVTS